MDFDRDIINPHPRDNTFARTMGAKIVSPLTTTNETYGHFSEAENKYKKTGFKERIFEDFFKSYVKQEESQKEQFKGEVAKVRLYDTTRGDIHVDQIGSSTQKGRRHMRTQDNIPINNDNVDKAFMASHDMGKYPSIISEVQAGGYIDRYIPYYKDKEVTFWTMNLDKGNMYRSNTLGTNPFAKSSGFTQPLHNTKSATQYLGNTKNDSSSKGLFLNDHDLEFSEKYRNHDQLNKQIPDLSSDIRAKIISACVKKGFVGLRKCRLFLKNLFKRKSEMIDKASMKYFLTNFGVFLIDKEVDFIYMVFDHQRKNEVNFNELLDSFQVYKFLNI
jgi:hypothetical protein